MFDENGNWVGGGISGGLSPQFASLGTYGNAGKLLSAGQGGATFSPTFMQSLTGYTDLSSGMKVNGWGGQALGLLQGLGSAYMGLQQYGLAKDQLQFSKDAFNKNYAAQAKMTNASLLDRQRARVASNPGAYQSVGDYMAQNAIAV